MAKRLPLVEAKPHPGGGFTAAIPLRPHDPNCTVRIYRGAVASDREAEKMARHIRSEFKPLRAAKGGQLQLDFRAVDALQQLPSGSPPELRHLKPNQAMSQGMA